MIRLSGGQSNLSADHILPKQGFIEHFQCKDYPELQSKLVLVVQDSPEKSETIRDTPALIHKAPSSTCQAQPKAKPRLGSKASRHY